MESQDLEPRLNQLVEDLYQGLLGVAAMVRQQESTREQVADKIEEMVGIICDHWPDCRERHAKEKGY